MYGGKVIRLCMLQSAFNHVASVVLVSRTTCLLAGKQNPENSFAEMIATV
jgi:hypothetical protein